MSKFTLYGNVASTATNRVRLMLADANFTDFEFINLNFQKAEHKSPTHLARNPFGRVPVLILPNNTTLYESRAICKFLAVKYSLPYMPLPTSDADADILARARFDQAESLEMTLFAPAADMISFEKFAKGTMGLPADEGKVSEARVRLEGLFAVLDRELAGKDGREARKWMVGEEFSVVDISFLIMIHRLKGCGEEDLVSGKQHLEAWWERCLGREAVKEFLGGLLGLEDIKRRLAAAKK